MNTLIITGGAIEEAFAGDYLRKNKFDYIIAADKGLVFCREMGIRPDLIVGDFDSADKGALEYYRKRFPERILRFRPEKDETDTEIALTKALENTEGSITILGATGTRLDHVLGNIQLLKRRRMPDGNVFSQIPITGSGLSGNTAVSGKRNSLAVTCH